VVGVSGDYDPLGFRNIVYNISVVAHPISINEFTTFGEPCDGVENTSGTGNSFWWRAIGSDFSRHMKNRSRSY
jgi:hypothetical protein